MATGRSVRAGGAHVEIGARNRIDRGLRAATRRLRSFANTVGSIGKQIAKIGVVSGAAATAAGALFSLKVIRDASKMEEVMNKFNVVFGDSAESMKAFSDDLGRRLGRSKRQMAEFLSSAQDLFVPLGFSADEATKLSKSVTTLAVDLASFNDFADADVMRDLQAALTGSGETMKKYGVLVNVAAVNQELLNQGLDPKAATNQQKVMARFNIIMKGTKKAQGDAVRSSNSFANQMKRLDGIIEDLSNEFGKALLPFATRAITMFADFAERLGPELARNFAEIVEETAKWAKELLSSSELIKDLADALKTADLKEAFMKIRKAWLDMLSDMVDMWNNSLGSLFRSWRLPDLRAIVGAGENFARRIRQNVPQLPRAQKASVDMTGRGASGADRIPPEVARTLFRISQGASGTFNPFAAQRLGDNLQGSVDKQTKKLEDIDKKLGELNKIAKNQGLAFGA